MDVRPKIRSGGQRLDDNKIRNRKWRAATLNLGTEGDGATGSEGGGGGTRFKRVLTISIR